jgi:probable H4MPT-linked C1 transfer pathway protein
MSKRVLGLDIGGANLKAAHSSGASHAIAFPLWKHPERLAAELRQLCAVMPPHDQIAVTMTGELCDCFATRREGVHAILQGVRDMAGATPVRVWSLQQRFLDLREAWENPANVAAANWLAQGVLVAQAFPLESVLLIDTGSTTTDIVYLNHGKPEPRGLTDSERLATGELVYTGVRRTPICAVRGMDVAAEFFATMLDVNVFLKLLPEDPDDCDTADGRPATRACAHARLARMRCADVETFSSDQARQLAERAMRMQWRMIHAALNRVRAGRGAVQRIIVSGSGEVLGRSVCILHPQLSALPITSLAELHGPAISTAACAYAVAMLAAQESRDER